MCILALLYFSLFFFHDAATTEIYTLSLHDALPISGDSFEMDAVGALRLSPLRRGLAIDSTVERRRADRKSGSAGMPRPISYAVFCLKKKKGKRKFGRERCRRMEKNLVNRQTACLER